MCFFFFQAEDGIRDAQESRGLGDVYKRQAHMFFCHGRDKGATCNTGWWPNEAFDAFKAKGVSEEACYTCLLYTSDAADDLLCVDLGGRRIIKKKKRRKRRKGTQNQTHLYRTLLLMTQR